MTEVWKEVEEYEGRYWVSNLGRVKSVRKVLKLSPMNSGYLRVTLYKTPTSMKTASVHRLVAKAFLTEEKDTVNHLDGNKLNNRADNLKWCSQLENNLHAYESGLKPRKLSTEDVTSIREEHSKGVLQKVIADKYGVKRNTISMIVTNRRRKA